MWVSRRRRCVWCGTETLRIVHCARVVRSHNERCGNIQRVCAIVSTHFQLNAVGRVGRSIRAARKRT